MNPRIIFYMALFAILMPTCQKEPTPTPTTDVIRSKEVLLDPSGYAPLTAKLQIETETPVRYRLTVPGKNVRGIGDAIFLSETMESEFEIPVFGLRPGRENIVLLEILNDKSQIIQRDSISIITDPLIKDMPRTDLVRSTPEFVSKSFILVNYSGHDGDPIPQRPFIVDFEGEIRWYLDYSDHPELNSLSFGNGLLPLQNRNFLLGDETTGQLYEINMFGEIQNILDLDNYAFNNHVFEKPDGNFLITVSDPTQSTIRDIVLELDRNSGSIINTWDLKESLDVARRAWPTDQSNQNTDWFQANGVVYDDRDNSIIVSGRTQGVVKLTQNNEVVWIVAPHRDWGVSGSGQELKSHLLQPLNEQGDPISNPEVLEGVRNHPDFEWSWYQHSPVVLQNGNLLLYDSGNNRNYSPFQLYSRVVEYKINSEDNTIQQIWDFGNDGGFSFYSNQAGAISYDKEKQRYLASFGAIDESLSYGKVFELAREEQGNFTSKTGVGLFLEISIIPPQATRDVVFRNATSIDLYPK